MAITRTAMIDDDGSGTTGTILNNAWKQELYNQIDANVLTKLRLGPSVGASLTLGQYDNFQPVGGATAVIWQLAPTVPTGITGVVAEPDGTQHLLINTTGVSVTLYNQQASSLAANRFIGPGYNHHVLGSWASVWIVYLAGFTSWMIQKP